MLQSWKLLKGCKWPLWLIVASGLLLPCLFAGIVGPHVFQSQEFSLSKSTFLLINTIITAPLATGALLIGIKKARGESISYRAGFLYFNHWVSLAIAGVIVFLVYQVVSVLGLSFENHLAASLAGIVSYFLMPFFILAQPLIVDKKLKIFPAIQKSIYLGGKNWLKIIILFFSVSFASLLCLILGFIAVRIIQIPVLYLVFLILKNTSIDSLLFFHQHLLLIVNILPGAALITMFVWIIPYFIMINSQIYCKLIDETNP